MSYNHQSLHALKLGQETKYAQHYDRTLLQAVPRQLNRAQLGIVENQPLLLAQIFGQLMKSRGSILKACRK